MACVLFSCKQSNCTFYLSIDIDECEDSSLNNCDQLCNNTEGSYHCDCKSGFQLAADQATCEGWYIYINCDREPWSLDRSLSEVPLSFDSCLN